MKPYHDFENYDQNSQSRTVEYEFTDKKSNHHHVVTVEYTAIERTYGDGYEEEMTNYTDYYIDSISISSTDESGADVESNIHDNEIENLALIAVKRDIEDEGENVGDWLNAKYNIPIIR
jgi:hypothetical protein